MQLDVEDVLAQLVAIASVNPMGRADAGQPGLEAALTAHLERLLAGLGLRTHRQAVAPGRENLVARLEGRVPPKRGGPLVILSAHQDTVPADGMTIEPFAPRVSGGRLYGRGACDVKGGMAAMLAAVARLAHQRPPGRPSVVVACTVDEEYAFTGAAALTADWRRSSGGLISSRPVAAVVAEPTSLDVIVAHKGVVRWRCRTRGRAAHSAQGAPGDNAIYKMARVLTAVERYQREVIPGLAAHPLCGPVTANVGTIHGGSSINIVPEQCQIELELRLPPGVTPAAARGHLLDYLAVEVPLDPPPEHDPPYMAGPPLGDDANGPLAERLAATAGEVTGRDCRRRGVAFATEAAFFARAGCPAVVFGPGSIQQAHTADEWLLLEQLHQAEEILYRFVMEWK